MATEEYRPVLSNLAYPQEYAITTKTKVQVKDMIFENQIETLLRHTLLERLKEGYLVRVESLETKQTAQDAFSEVLADLGALNKVLDFRLDDRGRMVSVLNKQTLLATWNEMLPSMLKKYHPKHPARPLILAMEEQLKDGDILARSMKNKGAYGILFPGLYGCTYGREEVESEVTIGDFFGTLALPLKYKTHIEKEELNNHTLVRTGFVNMDEFDFAQLKRTIKEMMDAPNYEVVLSVKCEERYTINDMTGLLTHATQLLKAEVKGAYFNESTHELQTKGLRT